MTFTAARFDQTSFMVLDCVGVEGNVKMEARMEAAVAVGDGDSWSFED